MFYPVTKTSNPLLVPHHQTRVRSEASPYSFAAELALAAIVHLLRPYIRSTVSASMSIKICMVEFYFTFTDLELFLPPRSSHIHVGSICGLILDGRSQLAFQDRKKRLTLILSNERKSRRARAQAQEVGRWTPQKAHGHNDVIPCHVNSWSSPALTGIACNARLAQGPRNPRSLQLHPYVLDHHGQLGRILRTQCMVLYCGHTVCIHEPVRSERTTSRLR